MVVASQNSKVQAASSHSDTATPGHVQAAPIGNFKELAMWCVTVSAFCLKQNLLVCNIDSVHVSEQTMAHLIKFKSHPSLKQEYINIQVPF